METMLFKEKNGVPYLQFPNLARFPALRHGVFTRHGGCSEGAFHNMNVGRGIGDSEDRVRRNRFRIARCMEGREPIYSRQVHGTDIVSFCRAETRTGFSPEETPTVSNPTGDAMATNIPGWNIAIQVADCQAVLLYAEDVGAVAAVHAGWRGSIADILGKTVREMENRFGCVPAGIHAGIGPSLGPCCAEFIHFRREIPPRFWKYKDERDCFDFRAISRDQLRRAGVPSENIHNSGLCTRCRTDLFFSYRGEGTTGRFAAVIGIR